MQYQVKINVVGVPEDVLPMFSFGTFTEFMEFVEFCFVNGHDVLIRKSPDEKR